MKCIFCQSDNLTRKDYQGHFYKGDKIVFYPAAEYFCLDCQDYFYWDKFHGVYEKTIKENTK